MKSFISQSSIYIAYNYNKEVPNKKNKAATK